MTKNKFAGLAEAKLKALEAEGQGSEAPETTVPEKPASNKAVKLENKQTSKLASKSAARAARRAVAEESNMVGVTIKIPEEKRIWWNVQAKMQRTTVTEAIIEALDKRFGEPKF